MDNVDQFGARRGEVVVDYGCGPGYMACALADVVGPEGHVHGVDLNADLLAVADQESADAGLAGVTTFHQVNDGGIPLDDSTVDRVIFKAVLLYLDDAQHTLAEARRVLRPGGVVVCQDSDFWLSACTAFQP